MIPEDSVKPMKRAASGKSVSISKGPAAKKANFEESIVKITSAAPKQPKKGTNSTPAEKKSADTRKKVPFQKSSKFTKSKWQKPAPSAPAPTEKTDWKKYKQEKTELRLKRRKTTKTLFDVSVESKKIYEKLKCKTTANKETLATDLHSKLNKNNTYSKFVMAHDTARIVQCMLKYAPVAIRSEITEELLPHVHQMLASKYSRFCVLRMIENGSNEMRQKVIKSFYGNIVRLASNQLSNSIIDTVYVTWATNKQKACMRQEYYGDIYKQIKDEKVKCIADTYKDCPHMKMAILSTVKAHIEHAMNKELIDHSLLHAVLVDYLSECSEENRNEMVTLFNANLASLASTKDGSKAATLIFWYCQTKDRRSALKSIKEHVVKISNHEHGYVFILAILSTIDDTKLLKKSILDVIIENVEEIAANEWGRKVIEWMSSPADKSFFHPGLIAFLEESQQYSKKDMEIRRKEIIDAVQEPLCKAISKNPKLWLQGGHIAIATCSIVKMSSGSHLKETYDSLASVVCDANWAVKEQEIEAIQKTAGDAETQITAQIAKKRKAKVETEEKKEPTVSEKEMLGVEHAAETQITAQIAKKRKAKVETEEKKEPTVSEKEMLGVEHAGLHIALKKMFKFDKEKIHEQRACLGTSIVEKLTSETLKLWIPLNRGCFLLINIMENAEETTQKLLETLLVSHKQLIKGQKHPGAKLLLKKLLIK